MLKRAYIIVLHLIIAVLIVMLSVQVYSVRNSRFSWIRQTWSSGLGLPRELGVPADIYETALPESGSISIMVDDNGQIDTIYVKPPNGKLLWRIRLSDGGLHWEYYVSDMIDPAQEIGFRYSDLDGDGMPELKTTWDPRLNQFHLVDSPWQ